jgi:5'-deoxynucleotidase YfbR-like HD superfamily hydrolase
MNCIHTRIGLERSKLISNNPVLCIKLNKLLRYWRFQDTARGLSLKYPMSVGFHSFFEIPALIFFALEDIKKYFPGIDPMKIFLLSFVHDFTEIRNEDVPLNTKLLWTKEEQRKASKLEIEAIHELFTFEYMPKEIAGYKTESLLFEIYEKKTLEAQMLSYIDKVCGFAQAYHEFFAGNLVFFEPVSNYLTNTFDTQKLENKFPLLKPVLFSDDKEISPIFKIGQPLVIDDFLINAFKRHQKETLLSSNGVPFYETYKKAFIQHVPSGLDCLIGKEKMI